VTGSTDLLSAYYHRVRPVVGRGLEGRCVGLLDPGPLAVAADALARSGVLRWRVAPGRVVRSGDALARALGERWVGSLAGHALVEHLQEHNRWEDRWDLEVVPRPDAALEVDLLLGVGQASLRRCRAACPPAACALMIAGGAASAVVALHPTLPTSDTLVDVLCQAVPASGAAARARPLDLLDAADVLAAMARDLLLPGGGLPGGLQQHMAAMETSLVLRGSPAWPWEVAFVAPNQTEWLRRLLARSWRRPSRLPRPALSGRHVLIVGCGTASNWLPELWADGAHLTLVDAKPFSVYNPVRQLAGTDFVGQDPKPLALQKVLERRSGPGRGLVAVGARCRGAVLRVSLEDPASVRAYRTLLDEAAPDLAILGTGRSQDDNYTLAEELRVRGIPHVVPTAFPGVSHYKHIAVDGARGPSYDDLGSRLPVDRGPGPRLDDASRQLYYGGTQPATLVETLPSVHSGLRLLKQLALPPAVRAPWLLRLTRSGRTCLVGANRVEVRAGMPLYGVRHPFQVVAYGIDDVTATGG